MTVEPAKTPKPEVRLVPLLPSHGLDRLAAAPNAAIVIVEDPQCVAGTQRVFPRSVVVAPLKGSNVATTDWRPLESRAKISVIGRAGPAGERFSEDVASILCRFCVDEIYTANGAELCNYIRGEQIDGSHIADDVGKTFNDVLLQQASNANLKKVRRPIATRGQASPNMGSKTVGRSGNGARRPQPSNAAGQGRQADHSAPAYTRHLVTLTGAQLLEQQFPPREMIVSPWLREKGLSMIFAERGIGKTWVGLNIAHAVAGGGSYLRWQAPGRRRVVYIDGEMPAYVLQERYASMVAASDCDAPEDSFRLVAADLQEDGLPDLADPNSQHFYDEVIRSADLIIVDNLSTICRSLRENESDSWGPIQEWLLRLRAARKSVVIVHHAGKGGAQRGTSRKEDVLDSVILLRRPLDYDAGQGARRSALHQVSGFLRGRSGAI
jgi:hypothetical protein